MWHAESQCEAAVQHREDRERDGKQPPTPCPSTLRSRAVSHNTAYTAAHHGEMDAGTWYRLVHRPPNAGRACGRRTLHISPTKNTIHGGSGPVSVQVRWRECAHGLTSSKQHSGSSLCAPESGVNFRIAETVKPAISARVLNGKKEKEILLLRRIGTINVHEY